MEIKKLKKPLHLWNGFSTTVDQRREISNFIHQDLTMFFEIIDFKDYQK
jgi:hypothetical protein